MKFLSGFFRLIQSDVMGNATQDLAVVGPVDGPRLVLDAQGVVDARVVDRRSALVADRLVVCEYRKGISTSCRYFFTFFILFF